MLQGIFGADSVAGNHADGFGGDLVVAAGSSTAAGLPPRYSATVALSVDSGQSLLYTGWQPTITVMCQPLNEKGAVSRGCVPFTFHGKTEQRTTTDAPNQRPGTWAMLRMLYQRADGKVQISSLTVYCTTRATTAADRTKAAKWLNAQSDKIATAVTTPTR